MEKLCRYLGISMRRYHTRDNLYRRQVSEMLQNSSLGQRPDLMIFLFTKGVCVLVLWYNNGAGDQKWNEIRYRFRELARTT